MDNDLTWGPASMECVNADWFGGSVSLVTVTGVVLLSVLSVVEIVDVVSVLIG